jgi:hypothetical protein
LLLSVGVRNTTPKTIILILCLHDVFALLSTTYSLILSKNWKISFNLNGENVKKSAETDNLLKFYPDYAVCAYNAEAASRILRISQYAMLRKIDNEEKKLSLADWAKKPWYSRSVFIKLIELGFVMNYYHCNEGDVWGINLHGSEALELCHRYLGLDKI